LSLSIRNPSYKEVEEVVFTRDNRGGSAQHARRRRWSLLVSIEGDPLNTQHRGGGGGGGGGLYS
jgi:hypothetical protein